MFSVGEKRFIAAAVEKILLELGHPEMPGQKPKFELMVTGKEAWSWAKIEPNWVFDDGQKEMGINPWNEIARNVMEEKASHAKNGPSSPLPK